MEVNSCYAWDEKSNRRNNNNHVILIFNTSTAPTSTAYCFYVPVDQIKTKQ